MSGILWVLEATILAKETQQFPAPEHPGSVVIVDDDAVVVRSLARLLVSSPYVVETCLTPLEAIEHVSAGHVRVLVSDITMPEMSGIELLRTIRLIDPDLPVVFVTGQPALKTAAEAIEFGAFQVPYQTSQI